MIRRIFVWLGLLALAVVIIAGSLLVWDPLYLPSRATHAYLWANGVHQHFINVDGHRIVYLESKAPKGGPHRPLVLVHGLGARKEDWAAIIPALSKAGFHVYAPDLLGYGESDAPVDQAFSLDQEQATVEHFMDRLGIQQADVGGWSMGGWISMKLALAHPERVRRLVLFDAAGVYFPFSYNAYLFTPQDRRSLQGLVDLLEPDKPFLRMPAWAVPGMLRRMRGKQWVIRRSFESMIDGHELLDFRLHKLKVPTLIVWGTEDKLTPYVTGKRVHELIEDSVLVGIRGCGHLAPGECSRQVGPVVVDYLKAATPPERSAKEINGPQR